MHKNFWVMMFLFTIVNIIVVLTSNNNVVVIATSFVAGMCFGCSFTLAICYKLFDLPSRDQADSIDLCDIEHIETSIKLTKEFLRYLKELQND